MLFKLYFTIMIKIMIVILIAVLLCGRCARNDDCKRNARKPNKFAHRRRCFCRPWFLCCVHFIVFVTVLCFTILAVGAANIFPFLFFYFFYLFMHIYSYRLNNNPHSHTQTHTRTLSHAHSLTTHAHSRWPKITLRTYVPYSFHSVDS